MVISRYLMIIKADKDTVFYIAKLRMMEIFKVLLIIKRFVSKLNLVIAIHDMKTQSLFE